MIWNNFVIFLVNVKKCHFPPLLCSVERPQLPFHISEYFGFVSWSLQSPCPLSIANISHHVAALIFMMLCIENKMHKQTAATFGNGRNGYKERKKAAGAACVSILSWYLWSYQSGKIEGLNISQCSQGKPECPNGCIHSHWRFRDLGILEEYLLIYCSGFKQVGRTLGKIRFI